MAKRTSPGRPDPAQYEGMNEIEAGERLADLMGDDGIDAFDSEARRRSAAETGSSPEDDDSGASPGGPVSDAEDDESEEEETEAQASGEDDGDDADVDGEEDAGLGSYLGIGDEEVSIDDDGTVRFAATVDGEASQVTLDELRRGYQTEASTTRKAMALSEERQRLEQQANTQREQLGRSIQEAVAVAEAIKGRLASKYEGINWEELRAVNPGEYAALRQQRQEELGTLDHEVQLLQQQWGAQTEQVQAENMQQHNTWVAEQNRLAMEHLPELATEATKKPLLAEYHEYLTGMGFEDQEIRSMLDHRYLRVLNDAVLHRRALKDQKVTKKGKNVVPISKKVKTVPKVRRPGAATGEESATKRQRRNKAMGGLRKTGSDRDAAMFAIQSGLAERVLGE